MTEHARLTTIGPLADADSLLQPWEHDCRQRGLLVTAPRRAILKAMLQQHQAIDAVALHQVAGGHHAATSLGTVYRFLRELHTLGWLQMQSRDHGRTLWRLHASSDASRASGLASDDALWPPWQAFLRQLEALGLVEKQASDDRQPRLLSRQPEPSRSTHDMLQEIIRRVGYRLT